MRKKNLFWAIGFTLVAVVFFMAAKLCSNPAHDRFGLFPTKSWHLFAGLGIIALSWLRFFVKKFTRKQMVEHVGLYGEHPIERQACDNSVCAVVHPYDGDGIPDKSSFVLTWKNRSLMTFSAKIPVSAFKVFKAENGHAKSPSVRFKFLGVDAGGMEETYCGFLASLKSDYRWWLDLANIGHTGFEKVEIYANERDITDDPSLSALYNKKK